MLNWSSCSVGCTLLICLFKIFKLGNNDELIELSYDELNDAFTIFNEIHRN